MKTTDEYVPKIFDTASIIIGLTGSIGSGCTLFAETLAENHGYAYYSLSSKIHRIADERISNEASLKKTKKLLQDIGNSLREEYGPHYLAEDTVKAIDMDCETKQIDKVVIDSIRNDMEVTYLRQFPNFYLVSVYADRDQRFKWLSTDNRAYTRQAFDADDYRDATERVPHGQQVTKCNDLSDIVINNEKNMAISGIPN